MKESIKKFLVIAALVAGIILLLSADAQMGESACEGDGYNQTTGECIAK